MKYAHRTTFAYKEIERGLLVPLGRGQISIDDPAVQVVVHDPHPLWSAKVWLSPGNASPHPFTQDILNGLARIQQARTALGLSTRLQLGYKTYYVNVASGGSDLEWNDFPWDIMATTSGRGYFNTRNAFLAHGWQISQSWGDDPARYFRAVWNGSGARVMGDPDMGRMPLFYAQHSFSAGSDTLMMGPMIIDLSKPGAMDYIADHLPRLKKVIQERTEEATGWPLSFDWSLNHKSKQYEWNKVRPTRPGLSTWSGFSPTTKKWERMPYDNDYTESQPVDLAPVRPLFEPDSHILVPEFAAGRVNALWGDIPENYQAEGAYAELYNRLTMTLASAGVWVYVQNWAPWGTPDQMDGWMSEKGLRATLGYSSYGGTHKTPGVVLDPIFGPQ